MQDHFHGTTPRILVVDDNRAIHDDFRKILCRKDDGEELRDLETALFGEHKAEPSTIGLYDVDFACQGEEAYRKVRAAIHEKRPFALAFVDMRMPPGWNGLESIERFWRVDPDLHIVICTAYSDHTWDDIVERLVKQDQWLILKKPFDSAEVSQLALALTRKWGLHKHLQAQLHNLEELVEGRTRDLRKEIEERAHAEEALREREARLPAIVHNAPDRVILFSGGG